MSRRSMIPMWMRMLLTLVTVQAGVLEDFGFEPSSDVQNELSLAWDIRAMRSAHTNFDLKKQIYTQGSDENTGTYTLQSLSTQAENKYGSQPQYNIYRHAFGIIGQQIEGDRNGFFDGNPIAQYADTLVNDLFLLDISQIESEAALSMNVYMAYCGALQNVLTNCKANDQTGMKRSLDQAIALWIGEGQVRGDDQTGYMFYNMAQYVGGFFNQFTDGDDEVVVNKRVIELFKSIQDDMIAGLVQCTTEDGYLSIRPKIWTLVSYANQLLMQMLVHRVVEAPDDGGPTDFAELYALSVLPQIAACDSGLFDTVLEYSVDLNVDQDTMGPLIAALQQSYSCLGLTCEQMGAYLMNVVPQCDDTTGVVNMAGYQPSEDVRKQSRIDRDIRQIRWFMEYNALDAAKDWYLYGRNSFFSLADLAKGETTPEVSEVFKRSMQLFGINGEDRSWAHNLIMQLFVSTGEFQGASAAQLQYSLDAILRGVVIYLGATNHLEAAVNMVNGEIDGSNNDALELWDTGVAFYIGSTEGTAAGGANDGGESIYGLANQLCSDFHVCGSDSTAEVNQGLIAAFTSGATAIKNQDGGAVMEDYNSDIAPNMIIPVLQGMLRGSVFAGLDPTGPFSGHEFGYSRSVLAFFQGVNNMAAMRQYIDEQTPSTTTISTVFGYVEDILALPAVQTDCEKVGDIAGSDGVARNVCKGVAAAVPAPTPTTPSPNFAPVPTPSPVVVTRGPAVQKPVAPDHALGLAWGRFQFSPSTPANPDSKIALDVKAMWLAADVQTASNIYISTTNIAAGLYGMPIVNNLARMSLNSKDIMPNDPIFNFYRSAFYNDNTFDDPGAQVWTFAHSEVQMALNPQQGSPVLAAETTVLMHSFFIILRQLHQSARQCQSNNPTEARKFLDSAVGIWIGDEQGEGEYNSGYMMYSMAQLARNHFRLSEAEAPANSELMDLFNDVLNTIMTSCGPQQDGYNKIRMLIIDIARSLSKPMVQQLLYYMAAGDKKFTKMLARAFVPQIASCSSGDYEYLQETLLNGDFSESTGQEQALVIEMLAGGLKCLGITCSDLGDASNSDHPTLSEMVSSICNDLRDSPYLAGYETSIPVREFSRLDLDILRISMLMRTEATIAAKEIYQLGYSSRRSETQLYTLQELSNESTQNSASELANQYISYYTNNLNFPDSYITQILSNTDGPFKSASRSQKAEAVYRMLQASVTFLGIYAKIEKAQNACGSGSVEDLDAAAALFVGSIEGTQSGGDETNSGVMLMGLGKEVCSAFDKCEAAGDSTANEFILFAFSDYKEWIVQGECENAASIKNESLLPVLSVGIIQAILDLVHLSEPLSAQSDDARLSALDAFAKAILPVVNSANATSAATIKRNTNFGSGVTAVPDGVNAVFDAFTRAIRFMGVDCDIIGTLQSISLSVCDTTVVAPPPDTSTTLGDDTTRIYTSTTYVEDRAGIALDVAQMEDDLRLDRKDMAELIYKNGENSPVYDKFGVKMDVRSLSGFSTNASNTMKNNPLYQTTVYALKDSSGNYLGMPATQYAESIVQESFGKNDVSTLAAEAAVSLNLWMEVANELYETLDNCKNGRIHDEDGIHSIDEVAAYWIGDGETAGDANKGHLLYNLAEKLANNFGTVDPSGQATVNLRFLRLLNEARLLMSFPESCSEDYSTVRKLQRIVNKIVAQMIVVQVQNLIQAIIDNDRDRVRVFAHGFVPLIKACNAGMFDVLKDKLISSNYDETQADQLISHIYSMLPCYGLTCDDIGYEQEAKTSAICEDPVQLSLAGYRTGNDVSDFAKLDLDIVLLDILMSQKAYGVAKDIYMFGRNPSADGSSSLSLQSLAKSTRRPDVPEYNTFVQYFGGDSNYADTMILEAFDSAEMPDLQRQTMTVAGSQYLVMYMGILEQMYGSVKECKAGGKQQAAALLWDKAAAYIIGSLEGPIDEPYSKRGGVFMWGLAKQHCKKWGTCTNIMTGSPQLNNRIRTLLYTGRGAVESGGCDALQKATDELTPLLRTSLVQSALTELTRLAETVHEKGSARDLNHARAFVAAISLLPLIDKANRGTAAMISKNLDMDGEPLEDGIQTVATGYVNSLDALGVNCEYVGSTDKINTCTGEVESVFEERTAMFLGLGLGVLAGAFIALFLFLWNAKKRRAKADQEQASFIPNKQGVLDEADKEFNPEGTHSNRAGASLDEMYGANATGEDFHEVDLPETV